MSVRRKRKMAILVPIVSMGDIAFLLIIFFVLTSQFMKTKTELTLPEAVALDQLEGSITLEMDEEGVCWLQGQTVPVGAMTSELQELLKTTDEKRVLVKIHCDLPQKSFAPVYAAVSESGAEIGAVGKDIPEP